MRVRNGSGRDKEKGISENGDRLVPRSVPNTDPPQPGGDPAPQGALSCLAKPDVTFIRKSFDWLSPVQQAGAALYLGLL